MDNGERDPESGERTAGKLPDMVRGHIVRGFDRELAKLRGIILEMGHRVIEQTQAAVSALIDQDELQAYRVLDREPQIDYLSLDADEEVFSVIARRQPTAIDLRIVLALSKIAGDVERAGDKAVRIAEQSLELMGLEGADVPSLVPELQEALRRLDGRACGLLKRGIQAVTDFDVAQSLRIFEEEPALRLASDDVRAILATEPAGAGLSARQRVCLLAGAHALERIGNHASNIAEQVIYVALGQDVRYRNREILIETLRHQGY